MTSIQRCLPSLALAIGLIPALVSSSFAEADETLTDLVNVLREEGLIDEDQHAELAAKAARKQEKKDWTDRVSVWGDFRARYEGFFYERDSFSKNADAADPTGNSRLQDRHRARYRGRLNVRGEVASRATVYFRVVSGSADPRSTNQTLGSGLDFDTDDVRFDLAYATLSPFPGGELPGVEGGFLAVDVGKVKNPFTWKDMGADALLWDGDITLEGGTLRSRGSAGPIDLFANTGVYIIDENTSAKDPKLFAGQLGGSAGLADGITLGARGSVYHFFSLDDAFFARSALNGGPGGTGGNFADGISRRNNSIQVIETSGFLEIAMSELFPVLVFGSYAHNLSARSSIAFPGVSRHDDAYAFGVFVGDKEQLLRVGFAYYHIEANVWPAMFQDSDILDGTPNRHGYVFSAQRQLFENVEFVYRAYLSDRIDGGVAFANSVPASDRLRMQADLKFEF